MIRCISFDDKIYLIYWNTFFSLIKVILMEKNNKFYIVKKTNNLRRRRKIGKSIIWNCNTKQLRWHQTYWRCNWSLIANYFILQDRQTAQKSISLIF